MIVKRAGVVEKAGSSTSGVKTTKRKSRGKSSLSALGSPTDSVKDEKKKVCTARHGDG